MKKETLINSAIKRTERYRVLKKAGKSEAEILSNFNTKTTMTVFSYDGPFETEMTPLDSLLYTKTFLRCAIMSMDPVTGYVKAYVGGPDFRFFKYDMVAKGKRQIGSTVKPFVYSKAIQDFDLTPCTVRPGGAPNVHWYRDVWNPRGGGGSMTILQALTISAGFMQGTAPNWIEEQGYAVYPPSELANWMHSFGITSYLDPVPALSLGASEISLREMVAAYSAFANGGMRVEPVYVSRICDNRGNILAEFTGHQTEIMSEVTYLRMLTMLMNVVNSGTGRRLRAQYNLTAEMGGKTGTTNFNSDGWFMGFTPELVTGAWVGGEERYIHFVSTAMGQGAEAALPIYALYMQQVYRDSALPYQQSTKFPIPKDFNPCEGELGHGWGSGGGGDEGGEEGDPSAVEGIFD